MENLTVAELKQRCKSVDIKLTKADGSSKLKKDLIKSLSSVDQSIVGGRKRRCRKGTSSRRRSRKGSKKTSKKRGSKRRSRKVSRRRGSKKRGSKRRSRKVSRRRGSKKRSTKKKSSRRRRRSRKQVGGSDESEESEESESLITINADSSLDDIRHWLDIFKDDQVSSIINDKDKDKQWRDQNEEIIEKSITKVFNNNFEYMKLKINEKHWSDYSYNEIIETLIKAEQIAKNQITIDFNNWYIKRQKLRGYTWDNDTSIFTQVDEGEYTKDELKEELPMYLAFKEIYISDKSESEFKDLTYNEFLRIYNSIIPNT